MKVAIDISPISTGHYLQHRVRGTGFYLNNLKNALISLYGEENFLFFQRGRDLDSNIGVVHYPYFEPFFLTLPFRKKAKTVVTVHDLTPLIMEKDFPAGARGSIKWHIQKKALMKSDLIITDSNSSKTDIVKLTNFDKDKIKVIYLAAAEYFKQVSREKIEGVIKKFNLPNKFILYVGDATPNKNLARLVEAINMTSYSLVIVGQVFKNVVEGENAWNKDLRRAKELARKNNKIISLGFVEDSDLVSLYNAATVLVMPSLYEGFGLPILEAMQSGCPVITTNRGSLTEVAGDSAIYVDPLNIDSIKAEVDKVIGNDDLRRKLREKGFNNAKKFNWNKTARETFEVYKELYVDK